MHENLKWYIAKCPTGAENNALNSFQELLMKAQITEMLKEFFIPYKQIMEAKNAEKIRKPKSNMANYIFLHMELTPVVQEILHKVEIMNLMLDENLEPITSSEQEIAAMKEKIDLSAQILELAFTIGMQVKVLEAPFEDFVATIEKVDEAKQMANVSIPILGRQISVQLPFKSIKRIID